MRDYETIKNELEYLLATEDRTPQNATFEALTAELMLDCRTLLLSLVEMSGVDLWGEDGEPEPDTEGTPDGSGPSREG